MRASYSPTAGRSVVLGRANVVLALLVSIVAALASIPVGPAAAHPAPGPGVADQTIEGDPLCNNGNFPGFVVTDRPTRQDFVPSRAGLAAVDLCLEVNVSTSFTVNLYEGGTALVPGVIKASRVVSQGPVFDFVHVDFLSEVSTTPGTRYVIEIPTVPSGIAFKWHATCGRVLSVLVSNANLDDCSGAPDAYPRGETNFSNIGVRDFGFRTLPSQTADLVGAVDAPKVVCPGQRIDQMLAPIGGAVTNNGLAAVGSFKVGYHISTDDDQIEASDPLVGELQTVPSLAGGATAGAPLPGGATVPSGVALGRAFVGILVDEQGEIVESDEFNNASRLPITITGCGLADVAGLTLAAEDSVPAGAFQVPISEIPPAAYPSGAGGAEAAPLQISPLQISPLQISPLQISFAGAPQDVLDGLLLSQVPIVNPDLIAQGGWLAIIRGTPLEGRPLQQIRVPEVLALSPPPAVKLGDVDLSLTPLKFMTWSALSAGTTPLADLALAGGQDWCTFLGSIGFDCPAHGIDPSTTNLVYLNLIGVPFRLIPWGALRDSTLAADSPLATVHLRNDPSGADYRIAHTPFRDIRVGQLSPNEIVDCSLLDVSEKPCSAYTLGEVPSTAFVSSATVATLLRDIPYDVMGGIGLGDAILGLMSPNLVPWERLNVAGLGAQVFANIGHDAHPVVRFSSSGAAALVDPVVSVALPTGFLFDGGARYRVYPDGSPGGAFTSLSPMVSGSSVSVVVPEIVEAGNTVELTFDAAPGLVLGVFTFPSVSVQAVDATHSFGRSLTNQEPIQVVDNETVFPNDDFAAADGAANAPPTLTSGSLAFSHISSDTDADYYRVRVPTSPNTRVRITLSHIPTTPAGIDYDLLLYGPATSPLQISPLQISPLQISPLQISGYDANNNEEQVPPESLQDVSTAPLQISPLQIASINRGAADEFVQTTSVSGEDGFYTVQVSGYNGSASPFSYMLHVTEEPPPGLPACADRSYAGGTPATAADIPASIGDSVNTVFLTSRQRLSALYGDALADQVLAKLAEVSARSDLGVNGVVLPVDGDAAVRAAYEAWDADECDVTAANKVVTEVVRLLDSLTHDRPNLRYVVPVGSDHVIPFVRVPDDNFKGNEADYIGTLIAAAGNNALTSAAANRVFLSDDIYGNNAPITWLDHQLYLPQRAVGRLVETPDQILYSIDQFILSGGQVDLGNALVTGYDFLTDGSTAVADRLAARLGEGGVNRLISDGWTCDDLRSAIPSADAALTNGHADHYRLLCASGFAAGDETQVFKSSEVSALPPSRLVFGVACHLGLSFEDVLNASPTAEQSPMLLDWAQAYAARDAILVANSGFGYGDDVAVALGERLMLLFAERLDGSVTVGEALRAAKESYFNNFMGVYGAPDEKTLQQSIFYGLPQFRVPASSGGVGASSALIRSATLASPPAGAGIQSQDITLGPVSFTETPMTDGSGLVVSASGEPALDAFRYPRGPQVRVPLPSFPGATVHGVLFTGFTGTEDKGSFNFRHGGLVIDQARKPGGGLVEGREIDSVNLDFPTDPGPRITSTAGGGQQLIWLPFRYRATGTSGGQAVGDASFDAGGTATVYAAPESVTDFTPPKVGKVEVTGEASATTVTFSVRTDPDAAGAYALWRTSADGSWHNAQLTGAGTGRWVDTFPKPAGALVTDLLIQTWDPFFNIGRWTHKGGLAPTKVTPPPDPRLTISVTCSLPGNGGWCRGDATATLSGTGGSGTSYWYNLDGKGDTRYDGTPISIRGTDVHHLSAHGTDGSFSEVEIKIDVDAPTITIVRPAQGATYTSPTTAEYSCDDAGSGILSCVGRDGNGNVVNSGDPIDVSFGPKSFAVTAEDRSGWVTTRTVTYNDNEAMTLEGFFSPAVNPPQFNAVKLGSTFPLKFRVRREDGTLVTDTAVVRSVQTRSMDCKNPNDETKWGALVDGRSVPNFRFDTNSQQFVFNLVTDAMKPIGSCHRAIVTTVTGQQLVAYLKMTK